MAKISILIGIVATLSMAAEPTCKIVATAVAPWFKVPTEQAAMKQQISDLKVQSERLESKVDRILNRMDINYAAMNRTNRNMVWKRNQQ